MATEPTHFELSNSGTVVVVPGDSGITEREIATDREFVEGYLDNIYGETQVFMKPYLDEWGTSNLQHASALAKAGREAAADGAGEWAKDLGDMFTLEFLENTFDMVGDAASYAYDVSVAYVSRLIELIDKGELDDVVWAKAKQAYNGAVEYATDAMEGAEKIYEKGKVYYKHRDDIIDLVKKLATGDLNGIIDFIENILPKIDPDTAKSIKNSNAYKYGLAIITDNETVLTFLTYASLILESIPPNYYVYAAGVGATYLLIEIVLNIVLAIFTSGAATAARLAAISARLAMAGAKITKTVSKCKQAINFFIGLLKKLTKVFEDLQRLGKKLLTKRGHQTRVRGADKTTLAARQRNEKRQPKCKICGSGGHRTPWTKNRGTIKYA